MAGVAMTVTGALLGIIVQPVPDAMVTFRQLFEPALYAGVVDLIAVCVCAILTLSREEPAWKRALHWTLVWGLALGVALTVVHGIYFHIFWGTFFALEPRTLAILAVTIGFAALTTLLRRFAAVGALVVTVATLLGYVVALAQRSEMPVVAAPLPAARLSQDLVVMSAVGLTAMGTWLVLRAVVTTPKGRPMRRAPR